MSTACWHNSRHAAAKTRSRQLLFCQLSTALKAVSYHAVGSAEGLCVLRVFISVLLVLCALQVPAAHFMFIPDVTGPTDAAGRQLETSRAAPGDAVVLSDGAGYISESLARLIPAVSAGEIVGAERGRGAVFPNTPMQVTTVRVVKLIMRLVAGVQCIVLLGAWWLL